MSRRPPRGHPQPLIDDCDLPELQCACHEPAVRDIYYTDNNTRCCYLKCNMHEGCNLLIREDLLNNYAEQMVNYCTMATDSCHEDAMAAAALLLKEKDQQISELENKLYSLASELPTSGEKDTILAKKLQEERYKSRRYSIFFWFMMIIYVAIILIPTV